MTLSPMIRLFGGAATALTLSLLIPCCGPKKALAENVIFTTATTNEEAPDLMLKSFTQIDGQTSRTLAEAHILCKGSHIVQGWLGNTTTREILTFKRQDDHFLVWDEEGQRQKASKPLDKLGSTLCRPKSNIGSDKKALKRLGKAFPEIGTSF